MNRFLNFLLDYISMPYRFLKWSVTAPSRLLTRNRNWRTFQDENRDKIEQWMKTHEESAKLPIYRDDKEMFHWVCRQGRRRTEREIKRILH